jgi:hypothetical protein
MPATGLFNQQPYFCIHYNGDEPATRLPQAHPWNKVETAAADIGQQVNYFSQKRNFKI